MRFLIYILVLCSAVLHGQENAALRYVTPFDDLIPKILPVEVRKIMDTVFFKRGIGFPSWTGKTGTAKWTTLCAKRKGKQEICAQGKTMITKDQSNRLIHYQESDAKGNAIIKEIIIQWLIADKPNLVVHLSMQGQERVLDSVEYSYNNAGLVSSIRHRKIQGTRDTTVTSSLLYNNKNQLIVYTHAQHGGVQGSFLFTYNEFGWITRRVFTEQQSQVVVAVDSLSYQAIGDSSSYYYGAHFLSLGGSGAWMEVDRCVTSAQLYPHWRDYYWSVEDRVNTHYNLRKNEYVTINYSNSQVQEAGIYRYNETVIERHYYIGSPQDNVYSWSMELIYTEKGKRIVVQTNNVDVLGNSGIRETQVLYYTSGKKTGKISSITTRDYRFGTQ
jgi:hypothetical protein